MTIAKHIHQIQLLIAKTAEQCGRQSSEIRLIGVTKGQPASAILTAYQAGLHDFAENYWQEAQEKIVQLSSHNSQPLQTKAKPITWHFIGPIQSNKTQAIANHFSWVHSVDREKIALLLSTYRNPELPPLNVCIQVNLDSETSKSGVLPEDVLELAQLIRRLPNLKLKGLMAIPQPQHTEEKQYASLLRLTTLFNTLNQNFDEALVTLSMGMTHDFVAAIRAGSTMIRIGQGIFGQRLK